MRPFLALALVQAVSLAAAEAPQRAPLASRDSPLPALAVGIGRPSALAVDSRGTVYIASPEARRVFRLDAHGITTVVAGAATLPEMDCLLRLGSMLTGAEPPRFQMSTPSALAVDASNNLYIADRQDGIVIRIDVRSGVSTTIAGSPQRPMVPEGWAAATSRPPTSDLERSSRLLGPAGLAVDPAGNVYVSDRPAHCVRLVEAVSGTMRTIAGSGISGYVGDGGPAAAARLAFPEGLALDRDGNLYIVDRGNHCVRRVDSRTRVITTVLGDGTAGASGDQDAAASARLRDPTGVAVDGRGDLVIADLGNRRLVRLDRGSSRLRSVAGLGQVAPSAVAVSPDGALIVGDMSHRTILRQGRDGAVATIAGNGGVGYGGDGGPATSAFLCGPTGIARDMRGNLYVAETAGHRVRRIDATSGIITTVAGNGIQAFAGDGGAATQGSLNAPSGVSFDATGALLIADSLNHRIRRVAEDGTIRTIAGTGRSGLGGDGLPALEADIEPSAVVVAPDGSIIIIEGRYGLAYRIDAQQGRLRPITGGSRAPRLKDGDQAASGSLQDIGGLVLNAGGDILLTEEAGLRIWRIEARTGSARIMAGRGFSEPVGDLDLAPNVALRRVTSLAADRADNVYFVESPGGVRRLDASTRHLTTVAGDTVVGQQATGLLLVEPDTLYFADSRGYVRRLSLLDGRVTTIAGGGHGF